MKNQIRNANEALPVALAAGATALTDDGSRATEDMPMIHSTSTGRPVRNGSEIESVSIPRPSVDISCLQSSWADGLQPDPFWRELRQKAPRTLLHALAGKLEARIVAQLEDEWGDDARLVWGACKQACEYHSSRLAFVPLAWRANFSTLSALAELSLAEDAAECFRLASVPLPDWLAAELICRIRAFDFASAESAFS